MAKIRSFRTIPILDSKGDPTIKIILEIEKKNKKGKTEKLKVSASVPSGVSTGKYEALELRDKDGRGISKAIEKIKKIIEPVLKNKKLVDQKLIDEILLNLDGTPNKSNLGANSILAVSIAFCRANSLIQKIPLYFYLNKIYQSLDFDSEKQDFSLPKPSFNMIEGGKHSENGLAFQEFMIIPQLNFFKDNFKAGIKIYQKLKEILEKRFGKKNIKLSKESAFSISKKFINKISIVFDLILEAITKLNYQDEIKLALDIAASEFYQNGKYKLDEKNLVSKEELIQIYQELIEKYPIFSIEDPFFEEDFESFTEFKKKFGKKITIFGDDLTVSNIKRIKLAKKNNACNGLILKPNQIGTVTETLEAARLVKSYNWKIMVSNRGGETDDDFIADLAVAINADFIKSGAPAAKERMTKYRRLVKIEKEINRLN